MTKNNYFNVLLISWSWIIAWIINYAYHPIMLQFLSIEDFWDFASLVGIFNILGILIAWIVLFLNKEYSKNIDNKSRLKYIFTNSFKILFGVWIVLFLIYSLFSSFIRDFLNIDNILIVIIVWLSIVFAFLWASIQSLLRSIKKFHILAFLQIIWPIFKLIIWLWLVLLWFSVFWAIWWFVVSAFLWVIISFIYVKRYFRWIETIWTTKELLKDFVKNKKSILNYFFVSLFFAIFMNIDVILAKNIFDGETAWIYAWISVLWKFLIFLMLSIETVYYWQIMEYSKNNLPFYLIRNPLILMFVWTLWALGVNYFIWEYLLHILKEELSAHTTIYLLILVFYSLLAFISFFTKVLVWWWKYYINYIFGFLSLLLIVIVYTFWTDSLDSFVYSFIFTWMFGLIITWWMFFIEYRKKSGLDK